MTRLGSIITDAPEIDVVVLHLEPNIAKSLGTRRTDCGHFCPVATQCHRPRPPHEISSIPLSVPSTLLPTGTPLTPSPTRPTLPSNRTPYSRSPPPHPTTHTGTLLPSQPSPPNHTHRNPASPVPNLPPNPTPTGTAPSPVPNPPAPPSHLPTGTPYSVPTLPQLNTPTENPFFPRPQPSPNPSPTGTPLLPSPTLPPQSYPNQTPKLPSPTLTPPTPPPNRPTPTPGPNPPTPTPQPEKRHAYAMAILHRCLLRMCLSMLEGGVGVRIPAHGVSHKAAHRRAAARGTRTRRRVRGAFQSGGSSPALPPGFGQSWWSVVHRACGGGRLRARRFDSVLNPRWRPVFRSTEIDSVSEPIMIGGRSSRPGEELIPVLEPEDGGVFELPELMSVLGTPRWRPVFGCPEIDSVLDPRDGGRSFEPRELIPSGRTSDGGPSSRAIED
ncbi:hypothetical protein C7M84_018824 [Penaeus vannamei]|uniref:Uncharacterized protein n=1 Tax=Penaeus vannamei TaxID=6689 RepID=A0A3R7NPJ4_PENVA|nr:hypothetical protein C7M84_018824 [Penaeus vannamei]